jgi:hypothetical protein
MAIKMRNNSKPDSICCECGKARKKVLDMFDVCIGGNIFTICDLCNEALFKKTLSASCHTNGRVKSKEDMHIINQRGRDYWKDKDMEELKRSVSLNKNEAEEIERKSSFFNGEE